MCVKIAYGAPSAPYVHYLVKKVKETGILNDKPKREKPETALEYGCNGRKRVY